MKHLPRHYQAPTGRSLGAAMRALATWAMALAGLAIGTLGMGLGLAAPAGATPTATGSSSLTLTAHQLSGPRSRPGAVVLTARASGASTVGLQVTFSVKVKQFEYSPLLQVGTATTGASGVATVTYEPTWDGPQEFVASAQLPSGSQLGPATATVSARATTGFVGTVEASRPDGTIGRWVVVGLLTLVGAVWVTLIAVVVRVYLTMGAGAA